MVDDDRREKNPSLILGGEIRVYYQGQRLTSSPSSVQPETPARK